MGSMGFPVKDNLVAFCDGVIDGESQIRECPAAQFNVVLNILNSGVEVGEDRIVESDLVCEKVGESVEISLIPAFLDETLNYLLVHLRSLV